MALLAIALLLATLVLVLVSAIIHFPRGVIVLACVVAALVLAYEAVLRRGLRRSIGLSVAGVALVVGVVLLLNRDVALTIAIAVCAVATVVAARVAFLGGASLPSVRAPSRPVMFYNPKSGGGKAERFKLAEEARKRGIEPIELTFERPLQALVDEALSRGADGLAMAGGDGSQAVVAAAASRAGVPYACIPSGTRNHFALDLGVDRHDVVGALDAFVDGRERVVDLAEVNGRIFVNNVSLGLYAEAVQSAGYREAKLRTLLDTIPGVAGPSANPPALRWTGADAREQDAGMALLISNNPYRLGHVLASGTRPRMDTGQLGVAVIAPGRGVGQGLMRVSAEPSIEVDSDHPVPAGIDGEAATLEVPVRFTIRPAALHVRIAAGHPGRSPSAEMPDEPRLLLGALVRIAFSRSRSTAPQRG
jgi:diacylglycerol kinase family enzyme